MMPDPFINFDKELLSVIDLDEAHLDVKHWHIVAGLAAAEQHRHFVALRVDLEQDSTSLVLGQQRFERSCIDFDGADSAAGRRRCQVRIAHRQQRI